MLLEPPVGVQAEHWSRRRCYGGTRYGVAVLVEVTDGTLDRLGAPAHGRRGVEPAVATAEGDADAGGAEAGS